MNSSRHLAALLLGLVLASCGSTGSRCNPSNCASGCCDANNTCQPGTASNACGQLGALCSTCIPGQACNLGFCGGVTGTGGGGGNATGGGGGEVTGGGGGESVTGGGGGGGGGSVVGGGGGGVTGGGGGVTGGGGGSVTGGGGGSVTGGGGGSATGGGGATGEDCANAIALVSGVPLNGQNLAMHLNDYAGTGDGCVGSAAPDAAYQVNLQAGQVVTLVVTPDGTFDPTISISASASACATTCLDGTDRGVESQAEVFNYKNTSGAAQTLFFVIDGFDGSTGSFSLIATVSTPPGDDTCAAPLTLTPGVTRAAQTIANYATDYPGGTDCALSDGPDRVYSISVPSGQRVLVTATPSASVDPHLSLVDGASNCGTACVSGTDSAAVGAVESLAFINSTGATQNYLVLVGFSGTNTGTFDIVATIGAAASDDLCAGATVLTAGVTLNAQTTVGYSGDYQSTPATGGNGCTNATSGPDRAYQFSLPSGQRAIVTVTPSGGFNPSLNVVAGPSSTCAASPRVCAGGVNLRAADLPEAVSISNVSGAARTYYAIVDSAAAPGAFSIGYTSSGPVGNDTCSTNTITLSSGTRTTENLTGFTADYNSGGGCRRFNGPDRVYRVQLNANQKYNFTVTPNVSTGGFDPVINIIPGPYTNCESIPRTCRGGADQFADTTGESGAFTNNTGATTDIYVAVADYESSSTNRDFTLTSLIGAAPAGETCLLPLAITNGLLSGQTTDGASADVWFAPGATGCIDSTGSADRVYSAAVPNGQTLTVTATPTAMQDVMINIVSGSAASCNAVTACVAASDVGLGGEPEVATFTNTSGSTQVVLVQVSGYRGAATYNLLTQIQ